MYRSAQRIRAETERTILMSRDSFSARCHRRTNRKGLYWNCQTVRISIRMLVGEQNGVERENERNRKQTFEEGSQARERCRDFFFRKIFPPPGYVRDVDTNGTLSVFAVEKSTNKESKITIINDKRRLSREDIERMVNEAERYHAEKQRERVAVKNNFESYCFNTKNTTEEKKVKKKIPEADRKCIKIQRDYQVNGHQYSSDEREGKAQREIQKAYPFFIGCCVFIEMIRRRN